MTTRSAAPGRAERPHLLTEAAAGAAIERVSATALK